MKILAIRGKNLASLAGEFTLDFQQEPLASSGLFAISGATGAGKSTLLDALCLALYDDTPRLSKAAGSKGIALPDGKNKPITAGNTGNLLRRGAAEAFAEVDFVGNDGLHYRASWSIRRAGGKAGGSLQKTNMSLSRLPDLLPVGGSTNQEVKKEIVQRIGLSFEQFTRAVLLAQNEFFAFLKANDNERGELLETLTGSEIYSAISMLSFQREKDERQTLDNLHKQLEGQRPLPEAELAGLQAQLQQAQLDLQRVEQKQGQIEQAKHWLNQLRELQNGAERARQSWLTAQQEQQAAHKQHEYFELVESVQGARPLLDECERSTRELENLARQVQQLQQQVQNAQQARLDAEQQLQQAQKTWQTAQAALQEAQPELDAAKALDAQIEALLPAHRQLQHNAEQAAARVKLCQQQLAQHQTQLTRLQQNWQQGQDWLAQRQAWQELAKDWARWDERLQQVLALQQRQAAVQQEAQQGAQALQQAQQDMAGAGTQGQQAQQELDAAQQQWEMSRQALAAIDIERLQQDLRVQQERRDLLLKARQDQAQWRQASLQEQELQTRLQQQAQELALVQGQLQEAQQAAPEVRARAAQAQQAFQRAHLACSASVEDLRAGLQPDAPCPVCGSAAHPYAELAQPLQHMLQDLQAEAERWQQAQQDNASACASARARLENLQREQNYGLSQVQAHAPLLAAATESWERSRLACAAFLDLAACVEEGLEGQDSGQAQILAQALNEAGRHLQQLQAQEVQWQQARRAQEQAQQRQQQAQQEVNRWQKILAEGQNKLSLLGSAQEARSEQLQQLAQTLDAAYAALDAVLSFMPAWQQQCRQQGQDFHAGLAREVQSWLAQQENCSNLQQQIQQLQLQVQHAQQEQESAAQQEQGVRSEFAASDAHLLQKRAARQALFGGRPWAQVQAALSQAEQQARSAQEAASHALQQQALAAELAQQNGVQLQARREALLEEQDQAGLALERWLSQRNADLNQGYGLLSPEEAQASDDLFAGSMVVLDAAQLRKLLAHDAAWLQAERRQKNARELALHQAHSVWQERQGQVQTALAEKPQLLQELALASEDSNALHNGLQVCASSVQEEKQGLQAEVSRAGLLLAQDADRRRQGQALLAEIEQQKGIHHLWAQLADLIGSADGKKFRNVAQQFTLDILLAYANQHLRQLARRYRLQRVPETLGMMVIDQDMGDEMRSVHSLSGGESFLVSLALALGLASLSSNRVQVESLFIDEGFGSLDADTLRVAMDALDGLQALGRKVGVITHVQEMTERIAVKVLVQKSSGGRSVVLVV